MNNTSKIGIRLNYKPLKSLIITAKTTKTKQNRNANEQADQNNENMMGTTDPALLLVETVATAPAAAALEGETSEEHVFIPF